MTNPVQIPDAAVRALEALKKAEMFIENGVEYGFIRLPEKPDPALDTLPKIKAAIATLTSALPHLPLGFEVKKLEWREPTKETNGCWTAQTVFGTYSVVNEGGWYAVLDDHAFGTGGFEWFSKDLRQDTKQTAFAAVQADFERRVCECHVATLTNEGAKPVAVAAVYREALDRISKFDRSHGSWETIAYDAINIAGRALSAEPAQGEQLPQDVINLVIAARDVVYGGHIDVAHVAFDILDKALEAFASRVPWENEPNEESALTTELGQ